jgi:hypothetical protein
MKNKKITRKELIDFHFIKGTAGIILDGIFVKNDGSEIIIRSAFFGDKYLHFRPLKENEISL